MELNELKALEAVALTFISEGNFKVSCKKKNKVSAYDVKLDSNKHNIEIQKFDIDSNLPDIEENGVKKIKTYFG